MTAAVLLQAVGSESVSIQLVESRPDNLAEETWSLSFREGSETGGLSYKTEGGREARFRIVRRGETSRADLAKLLAGLEGVWTMQDDVCECPHPGFSLHLQVGKRRHTFAMTWARIADKPAAKDVRAAVGAVKALIGTAAKTQD